MFKKLSIGLCMMAVICLSACNSGPREVVISPVGNEMKYETTRFEVKAGESITLVMNNTAESPVMKHNIVILNDKSAINAVGQAAISAPGNLPDHPAIIVATPMADAGQSTSVTFDAPSEAGEYVYICTYPGHYMMMQGVMVVQ